MSERTRPTPTDDEREAAWSHPEAVYSPEVFMAMQGLLNEAKGSPTHALRIAVSRQLSEQGEPSDAQVDAALKAWGHHKWYNVPASNQVAMRAALRASSAVTEQGEN